MSGFCPVPLPEDPVPKDVRECKECGLYKQGSRMIWGEGNPKAPIMVILDNPGAREDREGNSFVCGTRQTLQQAVNEVGLGMDELYVTFILKRRPVRAYEKERVRQVCMMHLTQQLQHKQPDFILCLGNVAVQSFFQDPDANVKTLRSSMHDVHGFKTAVAYHPLAVRRRPNMRRLFIEDLAFVVEQYRKM
ncbi:uracil-DNA glycosylase [Oceanobacillus sp. FSL H7-0719]|uniref:uracil-DNA glycosylase n=1 Tax=Oceanobacillus sp. FSL H7-0719 TaxID=2954507 RepID=UPI003246CA6A